MNTVKQISVCYIGELAYTPPKDVFLIERDEDYIRACRKLSAINSLPSGLKMWVRSKNHFVWLKNFTEQTGCPVQFCEMTPCLVLAEKWNILLPDWLTDTDITEQDLLNLDMEPLADQASFESRFLGHFLGAAFQRDVFHKDDLVEVIKALVSPEARAAFKKYPLLSRCLASTCETWAVTSNEIWVKKLCPRFVSDSDKVWQWFSLWTCLHGYPEKLLEYVLPPEQVLLVRDIPVAAVRDRGQRTDTDPDRVAVSRDSNPSLLQQGISESPGVDFRPSFSRISVHFQNAWQWSVFSIRRRCATGSDQVQSLPGGE
jgi:hypothetical protein